MKIELHTCDRCGRDIKVPEESLYKLRAFEGITDEQIDLPFQDGETLELCFLCYEAMRQYILRGKITQGQGILDHENEFRQKQEELGE